MDAEEYARWSAYMKSRRGKWSVDPIHDGVNRDLIAFLPNDQDHTRGVYVSAYGSTIHAGTYEGGHTSVTDGFFYPRWGLTLRGEGEVSPAEARTSGYTCRKPTAGAWKLVVERLGIPFLLGTVCDVSARSAPR